MNDALHLQRSEIETLLDAILPDSTHEPCRLHQAMRYSVLSGGKRLRPLLVLTSGGLLGAQRADLDVAAAAVELIHVYSLIHDDLPAMDDDNLRRGRPTCHIAFDQATAILAGDALQTLAFEVLSSAPLTATAGLHRVAMIHRLAVASGTSGMGGGQALDLAATGTTLGLDDLSRLHGMKTGALIEASVMLGADCAGLEDPQQRDHLVEFSRQIGLAFQIQDDILDVEGSTAALGKPQGSDLAAHKATYPALLGLPGAKREARRLVGLALQALEGLPYNTNLLTEFAQLIIERDH